MDLPNGVYVDMPEEQYFALDRLGSTDLSRLSGHNPEDWWYGSRHNLQRKQPKEEEPYLFGRALHCYLLDGHAIFLQKFVRTDFTDYKKAGAAAELAAVTAAGKTRLRQESYANVFAMGELVRAHDDLGAFFRNGMSEVTVLYDFEGLPMRARFDKLTAGFIVDLKTFGNHKSSVTDVDTCIDVVVSMKYETQRFIYDQARRALCEHVKGGNVYGASPKQQAFLERVALRETWQWCWIFYKVLNNSAKSPSAPILTPLIVEPQDATYVRGEMRVALAIERYKSLVAKWGLEVPWARINREAYPTDDDFIRRYEYWKNQLAKPQLIKEDADDV